MTERWRDVAHIGHAELLTPAPEASLEYFTTLLGLTVAAEGAGGASLEAEGGDPAVAAERADRHRLQEPDPADSAVAAAPAANAAAAGPDRIGLEDDGIAPFEHLGVGEPGVRHLRLDHVGPVEPFACS